MTIQEQWALIKKHWISATCGIASLALAGGIYFLSDLIPSAEAELAEKMAEGERLSLNNKFADKLSEQYEALVGANKTVDTGITIAGQMGKNTQYFYTLESETGVKLVEFRPQAIAAPAKGAKATFTPVGFNVSTQGTLPQILDFLRRLEGGSRYARILTASVSGNVTNRKAPLTLSLSVELLGLP